MRGRPCFHHFSRHATCASRRTEQHVFVFFTVFHAVFLSSASLSFLSFFSPFPRLTSRFSSSHTILSFVCHCVVFLDVVCETPLSPTLLFLFLVLVFLPSFPLSHVPFFNMYVSVYISLAPSLFFYFSRSLFLCVSFSSSPSSSLAGCLALNLSHDKISL